MVHPLLKITVAIFKLIINISTVQRLNISGMRIGDVVWNFYNLWQNLKNNLLMLVQILWAVIKRDINKRRNLKNRHFMKIRPEDTGNILMFIYIYL